MERLRVSEMRNRCFLVLLVICVAGCESATSVVVTAEVSDPSGSDRLQIRDWEIVEIKNPEKRSHDFHSLVWQVKQDSVWKNKVVLTEADIERNTNRRRWVSNLHSFDAATGYAILKLAEGDAPKNSRIVNYRYSWREWDVENNKEVRMIQECSDPFEAFETME